MTIDENLFLQDSAPLAAGQTVAALPAGAEGVAFSAAAALETSWKHGAALAVDASYAPEVVRYTRYTVENHVDHRFTLNAGGTVDAWKYDLKTSALFTDGSNDSPVFNRLGGVPCIGAEPVRSRRSQDIYRGSLQVTRALGAGFVRGLAATSRQDFHTREKSLTGYANYADRSETTGGFDAGWKVTKGLALYAGVRAGRQQQANLLGTRLNYTNTLTRWLGGVEGTLNKSWKVALAAGPDQRRFGPDVAATFNRRRSTGFAEGSVTWTPDPADTVTLTGKRYLWLSSAGRNTYVDSLADLSWKRRLNAEWSGLLGLNYHSGDNSTYNPSLRHDRINAARAGLTRKIGAYTFDASWQREWSESAVANTPGRVYHRNLASLGATRAW